DPGRDQPPTHEPHPPGGVVLGLAVPGYDGRDGRGGGDVVIRRIRSALGSIRRLVDGLDFLGQQGRIRRDCEPPAHHSMVAEEHDTSGAGDDGPMSAWPAPVAPSPVHATVTVPGSKSQTNRALVLAALGQGTSTISGALRSRDTDLMIGALRSLGLRVDG